MDNIIEELVEKKRNMFLSDPIIRKLQQLKLEILTTSIPSYVVCKDSLSVKTIHNESVQNALDHIDEELRLYIKINYKNIE